MDYRVKVTDSETGQVVLDGDCPADNPDATGAPTTLGVNGFAYHGVKVWVEPGATVHPWEDAEDHVFLSFTDKSVHGTGQNPGIVHTLERPLPGGAMGRFLVTVEETAGDQSVSATTDAVG